MAVLNQEAKCRRRTLVQRTGAAQGSDRLGQRRQAIEPLLLQALPAQQVLLNGVPLAPFAQCLKCHCLGFVEGGGERIGHAVIIPYPDPVSPIACEIANGRFHAARPARGCGILKDMATRALPPDPVASQLLAVLRKAPVEGAALLGPLLARQALSLDATVDSEGTSLRYAVHELALNRGRRQAPAHIQSFQSLFSADAAMAWEQQGLLTDLFATRHGDRWLPLVVLDIHEQIMRDTPNLGKVLATFRQQTDGWVCKVLPVLPKAFWAESGGELLARCMELDLHKSTHAIWSIADPLSVDAAGTLAIARATRQEHWDRIIKQDPGLLNRFYQGEPVWAHLAKAFLVDPDAAANPFRRAFEGWLIESTDPELAPVQTHLARANMVRPNRYQPDQWVTLLRRAGPQWINWTVDAKSGARFPAWERWLHAAKPAAPLLQALDGAPDLMAQVSADRYARLAQVALLRDVSTPVKGQDPPTVEHIAALLVAINQGQPPVVSQPDALSTLVDRVIRSGWVAGRQPLLSQVTTAMSRLDLGTATVLSRLGALDPRAWWGEGEPLTKLANERIGLLLGRSKLAPRSELDAWAALHEGSPHPSIQVTVGFARAAQKGDIQALLGIAPSVLAAMMSEPQGQDHLASMRLKFNGARRAAFDAWVQAGKMEAATAPVAPEGPRRQSRL